MMRRAAARWAIGPSLLLLAACGSSAPSAPPPAVPAVAVAPIEERPRVRAPSAPRLPPGYVEVHVVGIAPTPDGAALLLSADDKRVLPIFIGGTEALSIDHRHRGVPFRRPLTHDLLDAAVRELGAAIMKVH